jgi:hypothetical protein
MSSVYGFPLKLDADTIIIDSSIKNDITNIITYIYYNLHSGA